MDREMPNQTFKGKVVMVGTGAKNPGGDAFAALRDLTEVSEMALKELSRIADWNRNPSGVSRRSTLSGGANAE